jgi:putative transposase
MAKWKKLAHVVYQCSYHIVWTPRYRFRVLDGDVKDLIENKIKAICEWKEVEILELNVRADHVHMVVTIPPRIAVSALMGILKGKTAIAIFKGMPVLKKKPYWGNHFWSRGYCVTTIGIDEEKIRRYVKYQEENEKREEEANRDYGLFERPNS